MYYNYDPGTNCYFCQIQCAQNSFSLNMRITIRAMCQKCDDVNKQIQQSRSELSKIRPTTLVQSICTKIQEVNSKLFNHSHQFKAHKVEQLTGPPITCDSSLESLNTVQCSYYSRKPSVSDAEKSILSKGLKFVPISKKLDELSIKQDVEKFLCHVKLNVFFHDKEDNSNTSNKDIFETLQTQNSKWTPPPEGQFASLDIFINKCHHDSNKLNFNHNTKFSSLSSEERTALEKLRDRSFFMREGGLVGFGGGVSPKKIGLKEGAM